MAILDVELSEKRFTEFIRDCMHLSAFGSQDGLHKKGEGR